MIDPLLIRGLATAVPPTRLDQTEAEAVTRTICRLRSDQAELLHALYRQTGIVTRHVLFDRAVVRDVFEGTTHTNNIFLPAVCSHERGPTTAQRMRAYEEHALPLALTAADIALANGGLAGRDITHLITVSCTGFAAPGWDIGLIKQLGLPATVQRTHVGFMGCHGALNGMRVARAYASDPAACVLLVAVELCSLHYYYIWDPKRLVANALFADGAAALVGVGGSSDADDWKLVTSGSCLFPESEWAMTWTIGDHGFDMTLSTKVPNLLRAHLRPWLTGWLADHQLSIGEIGSWAVHPGGPRVLGAIEEALGLPAGTTDVSREVLAECGNMSSPTVLFLLERLRQRRAPRPCVALGFGPGLVVEAALFE